MKSHYGICWKPGRMLAHCMMDDTRLKAEKRLRSLGPELRKCLHVVKSQMPLPRSGR